MIEVNDVRKRFGAIQAVDGVSFQVQQGEVLGFLGPNGAGKSTTMRMLTGFLPLSAGSVKIDGKDIEAEPLAAKAAVGYLPENAPSYPDMTVEKFLKFCGEVRGLSGEALQSAVAKAVEVCRLEGVLGQTIDTLSKGYHHRVCFAQAILNDPPNLILDEPTDGLDPNQKNDMRSMIRQMGKNKAIIISTHILEEVDAICTRVVIINHGKLIFNGPPEELRKLSPEAGAVRIITSASQLDATEAVLRTLPEVASITREKDGLICYPKDRATALAPLLHARLDAEKQPFAEISTVRGKLDQVFRDLTRN